MTKVDNQPANPLKRRPVVLFSESIDLIEEVAAALKGVAAGLSVKSKIAPREYEQNEADTVFLVHDDLQSVHPIAIIENLYFQDTSSAANIALIVERSIDYETEELLKRYGLRGYIPRKGLSRLLVKHISTILETDAPFRKNVRLRTSFPVSLSIGTMRLQGTCVSLSEEGMFIQSPTAPPKNRDFDIAFTAPGTAQSNVVRGHILYSTPVGFAVHFRPKVQEIVHNLLSSFK